MRLFDFASQFKGLYELCEDIEVNQETGEIIDNSELLSQLFSELEMDLSDKLENTAYLIKELETSEKALKDEAKRLTEKAKVLENRQTRIKELIKTTLESSGQTKIKTDKFSFSISNRKSFNYDGVNMFALDSQFVRVKEELDKNKMKEFIKAGGTIDGVFEVETSSLSIR